MIETLQIVLKRDLHHEQVEFPDGMPRPEGRRDGSLHLQRGKPRVVTVEEYAYIRSARPEIFRCLDRLPEPKASGRALRRIRQAVARKAAAEKVKAGKPIPKPRRRTRRASSE